MIAFLFAVPQSKHAAGDAISPCRLSWSPPMTALSDRPLPRPLGQGFAVAALLAVMALMAFAAGVALLIAMIGLPISIGFMALRQRLRVRSEPAVSGASALVSRLTPP
jgi:hypothetical protein